MAAAVVVADFVVAGVAEDLARCRPVVAVTFDHCHLVVLGGHDPLDSHRLMLLLLLLLLLWLL